MKFVVLIADNLTSSYSSAVDFLEEREYDSLFLDFPIPTERAFRAISCGVPWKQEIAKLEDEGLIKDPEDSQMVTAAKPLFEYLKNVSVDVFCYRDLFHYDLFRKFAGNTFALTASSKIFRIKASRWLSLMEDLILTEVESIDMDSHYVIENAWDENVVFGSEGLADHLLSIGYDVETTIIDRSVKPLDLLKSIVAQALREGKDVPDNVIEALVKQHLAFVDLIIQSKRYEDAYLLWKNKISCDLK
jgi:hypothetical protein